MKIELLLGTNVHPIVHCTETLCSEASAVAGGGAMDYRELYVDNDDACTGISFTIHHPAPSAMTIG
eukprot:scaffold26195_cov61-Attheya_sp.AAC.2